MDTQSNNDYAARLNAIIDQLQQLGRDYPCTEYNLMLSKFKEDGSYESGNHVYNIKIHENLDIYAQNLMVLKNTMIERNRFQYLLHLPEFRVVCDNELMDGNVLEAMKREGGGDWVSKNKEYVVWMKRKSPTGGWTFFLKDREGNVLKPPFPYQGYHSSRFIPADYTKNN